MVPSWVSLHTSGHNINHQPNYTIRHGHFTTHSQLLERAKGQDGSSWSLLHVAIVELRDNVFMGRLFFGGWWVGYGAG